MQVLTWGLHFSILSDLKKTTVVVESLSKIQPDVLFQRLPAYFKKDQDVIQLNNNMQALVMAKEQNMFHEGCKIPRGCGKSKR